jgi:hypothetical protein
MHADERRCNPEGLRGEWWIDDSGFGTFADGDVGDTNHESQAFWSALGIDPEESTEYRRKRIEQNEDEVLEFKAKHPEDEDLQEADAYDIAKSLEEVYPGSGINLVQTIGLLVMGADAKAVEYFESTSSDAREYMMENEGWIRVSGNNFQLMDFDDDALSRIKDFLGQEYPEDESLEEDSFAIEELKKGGKFFSLTGEEIMNSGKSAGDLKFGAMKANPHQWPTAYERGHCDLCHREPIKTFQLKGSPCLCGECAIKWEAWKKRCNEDEGLWSLYLDFMRSIGVRLIYESPESGERAKSRFIESYKSGRGYARKESFERWLGART